MIDYESIQPMMSLSFFIIGVIAVLIIGRAIVELIEKRKSPQDRGNDPAGLRRLSPSQKCIQSYYKRNQTENKGA